MGYLFIDIISLAFTVLTRKIFYDLVFDQSSLRVKKSLFWTILFVTVIPSYLYMCFSSGDVSTTKALIMTSIQLTESYLVVLCYNVRIKRHRFYAVITEYIFEVIAEAFAAMIISIVNHPLFDEGGYYRDSIISFTQGIIWFFILSVIVLFLKKTKKKVTFAYSLLLLATPVITGLVIVFYPVAEFHSDIEIINTLISLSCLMFLNVINYYLLEAVLENHENKVMMEQMRRQVSEQSEKFELTSWAYKETRRVIHDTKQYYSMAKGYIDKGDIEKLDQIIGENMSELDRKYDVIDTGNLVIDTFVGNFLAYAREHGIRVEYNISVNSESVPVLDYDLCAMLGNLLDNCKNACSKLADNERYVKLDIVTKEKFFVIRVENPRVLSDPAKENRSYYESLLHGFGINNVKALTRKYKGIYYAEQEDNYWTTVSIPIRRDEAGKKIQVVTEPGLNLTLKDLKEIDTW